MDDARLRLALGIERKALAAWEQIYSAADSLPSGVCEHLPEGMTTRPDWAYIQCMLLAASIDKGRDTNSFTLDACMQGGSSWDPPSVVYWTLLASRRYPDREATVLLLELWNYRRRIANVEVGPSKREERRSELSEGGARFLRRHPLLDVQLALSSPMPSDVDVPEISSIVATLADMIHRSNDFDWSQEGLSNLSAWAAVAPVTPQRESHDWRSVVGELWIKKLVRHFEDQPERLISEVRERSSVIRELIRMPGPNWLRQPLLELLDDG